MFKYFYLLLLLTTQAHATEANPQFDKNGYITEAYAHYCIQLNKDMNLASRQMLDTEMSKAHFKSMINHLHDEIQRRRDLIENLDKNNNQTNNDNYNQLIDQFEQLIEQRKENIVNYDLQHQFYVTQHNSVVRLEKRFSKQCLQQMKMTETLYNEVCINQPIRWCQLFNF